MGSRRRVVIQNGNTPLNNTDTRQVERRKIKKEFKYNKFKKSRKTVRNILIITILSVLMITSSVFYYRSSKTKPISKISEVLRKNVELSKKIISQVEEFKELIQEDPIVELIKSRMRPIQERIASLKTQTLQYEKMEHISGGPTQFMSSTLSELDKIETEHLERIGLEVARSISRQYVTVVGLAGTANDILKDGETLATALTNDETLRSLTSNGIFLVPLDGKFDRSLEYNSSLLIETHLELADLYETLENITEKMEKDHGFNIAELENMQGEIENKELLTLLTEYLRQKELINNVVLENYEKYPLLGVLKQNSISKVQELFGRLMIYETEKRRPWLDLQSITRIEIEKLKKRVQNLKYSYSKKNN